MEEQNAVQEGWDFATNIMGADAGALMGDEYISAVEKAIQELEKAINDHEYRNLGVKQLQGYMLEEWGAHTFNVDAAAAGSQDSAAVLHSLEKNSVDVQLKSGQEYSFKSYASGELSARQQAKFDPETGRASYYNQGRVVPEDQLQEATEAAHRQMLRNQPIRPDVAEAYADTEKNLTDVVKNDDGVSSKGIKREELDQIARESKDQSFKAEDHGITADSAIKPEYLLKQSVKAGVTAAAITVILQLAPEIFKAVDYLCKNGELDISQIKNMGIKGISAGCEGFLRGSIASSVLIMCEKGAFGSALKGIDPTGLGVVVALVMQTVKNSILVAAGKMAPDQMGAAFADAVIVSGGYLAAAHIGGIIGQAFGLIPGVSYLLGSLLGASVAIVYNIGKKKLISFCVDTGFTCFGLVDQNYELPEEVLEELGIETIPVPETQINKIEVSKAEIETAAVNVANYETVAITVLKRGIIGVNKIGYVF